MGWYTALGASGALSLAEAARLVETMGSYQAGNVQGGQVLYPTADEQWRPAPQLQARVDEALTWPGVELSIRLGGMAVLGGPREAVRTLLSELPEVVRGPRSFPLQLPLHSAFHTSVMVEASRRAQQELADLEMGSPQLPLIDGLGRLHARWASPELLLDYTLGAQVHDTFDLSASVLAGLQDYAPDAVLLPGPGETLGGSVAQVMIQAGWRGLRDRQDFLEAQQGERPVVISMCRPDQRALVATPA
jgi:[acyl-carrier-protein] S-malonyltransferase